ncbi:hypothetical protein AB685_29460 [Bacillus sp. LL01]|uniref:zinc-finger domain-containing protein n=1 Tax=Bacillus sp. LL01 TaxID=1665556 RepID=UPI00064D376F|nr:zinc-finger domain-containing protein [Bacillus sp. LL01]KMJ55023.1 hypothetical protein AB685_29460 [Bacillus sp. LL01]
MKKSELIIRAGQILDKHCRSCHSIKTIKGTKNERNAYCLANCEVYQELRAIGDQLEHRDPKFPRKWTSEEVFFLKHNFKQLSVAELAKKLGRTEKAVDMKLRNLR